MSELWSGKQADSAPCRLVTGCSICGICCGRGSRLRHLLIGLDDEGYLTIYDVTCRGGNGIIGIMKAINKAKNMTISNPHAWQFCVITCQLTAAIQESNACDPNLAGDVGMFCHMLLPLYTCGAHDIHPVGIYQCTVQACRQMFKTAFWSSLPIAGYRIGAVSLP